MEKRHNRDGLARLLPGLRFQPTDEELVFEYLRCKIFGLPLPASIIPEVQFSKFDPWDLPGDQEEERYFFSQKQTKNRNGTRANRVTRSGYWKATRSGKQIYPPPTQNLGMEMIGLKKSFVFHQGKSPNGCRTDWFMHEYNLLFNEMPSRGHVMSYNNFHQGSEVTSRFGDWIVCHVYRKQYLMDEDRGTNTINCDDNCSLTANSMKVNDMRYFNTTTNSCSSSVSSSGSVSGASPNELQQDEVISCSR